MLLAVQRWIVIVVAVASLALQVALLTGVALAPAMGITFAIPVTAAARIAARIDSVAPRSGAAEAGLKPGDVVRFTSPEDEATLARREMGSRVRLHVAGKPDAVIVLGAVPLAPRDLIEVVILSYIPLLAIVIAWRAWGDPQSRRLAIAFLWIPIFLAQTHALRGTALVDAVRFVSDDALLPWGAASFVFFCAGYAATPERWRIFGRRAGIAASLIFASFASVDDWLSLIARQNVPRIFGAVESIAWVFEICCAFALLVISLRGALGAERRRIGWVLATAALGLGPYAVFEIVAATFPSAQPWPWLPYTRLLLPIGIAYATLRHRVVDLGFVLNRAAVFGVTTALLVGLFSGMQWAVDHVLAEMTRTQGFVAQLVIAVVVFYIVRFARARTEVVLTNVFFAGRRRRIDAVMRVANDLDGIVDASELVPFVIHHLRDDAGIEAAVVFHSDDETRRVAGSLDACIAFPIVVRNRSQGELICALPAGADEFAPDERAALAALAVRIAIARDDLSATALRAEMHELRNENARLRDRLTI